MLINLRNALMTGKRLPYDAEVEYIRGTGTQYINTGIYQNPNTEYKVTVMPEASTNLTVGNFNGGGAYGFRLSFHAGGVFQDWYSSRISISAQSFNQIYTATVKRGSLRVQGPSIDQTATGTQSETTSSAPIYLLSAPNPPGAIGAAKLYSFQVWQNGTLVFDGIPVRKGTVGYLYDRVSGKLFGNAGTGAFLYGNDV